MFLKFYMALGNSKLERFKRFMYILILISIVICYGFHSDAINLTISKVIGQ